MVTESGLVTYRPMRDQDFSEASAEWLKGLMEWQRGARPNFTSAKKPKDIQYWEWSGPPPDRALYRPWKAEEATWYQCWEVAVEGIPVSPPFPTMQELRKYLSKIGVELCQE